MDIFDLTDDESFDVPFEAKEQKGVRNVYKEDQENALLKSLNKEQLEAVQTTEGALLVLAGAGTGKTRVLTTRIAYLIQKNLCRPYECMAVTFTNKAASEMKERLFNMIGPVAGDVWLGTFHKIGLKILRRHAQEVGLSSDFNIFNQDDSFRLLKLILKEYDVDVKKYSPKSLAEVIDSFKNKGFLPESLPKSLEAGASFPKSGFFYREYQERLRTLNAVDFSDLLLLSFEVLKNNPELALKYQHQFRYILVDEYQDTNIIQYLWLKLLAKGYGNLCCVGDDDQSIYSWRGAEVENILRFSEDYPKAKTIRLESNYRSTAEILGAASSLIAHNKGRLGKTLRVAPTHLLEGKQVEVKGFWDSKKEAYFVAEDVSYNRKGRRLSDLAVLVRANFQTREFEEAFSKEGIAYKVIGGFRFYEREEIKDMIAYLRVVAQPKDDMAFERIVNKPKRGIGAASLDKLREFAASSHQSLFESIDAYPSNKGAFAHLREIKALFVKWQEDLEVLPFFEVAKEVLYESGYMKMWKDEASFEAKGKVENLGELLSVISADFETITAFLEHVSLVMDTDELSKDDCVNIMTLHGAKGLEFSKVYLPGWEEGIFPHQKSLDEGEKALEEERRLAYVGLTRAKEEAVISFVANRQVYGQWQASIASRFLSEIDSKYLKTSSQMGMQSSFENKEDENFDEPYQNASNFFRNRGAASPQKGFSNSSLSRSTTSLKKNEAVTENGIKRGSQVYHEIFGYGVAVQVDGNKVEVYFEGLGRKKLMSPFLEKVK
ncbi:MAG: hypothetical protein EOM53_03760 [Alphaproteobacteria bacterium]|nr:hypothetical protein [Alphaproteobacteria bacterium]